MVGIRTTTKEVISDTLAPVSVGRLFVNIQLLTLVQCDFLSCLNFPSYRQRSTTNFLFIALSSMSSKAIVAELC